MHVGVLDVGQVVRIESWVATEDTGTSVGGKWRGCVAGKHWISQVSESGVELVRLHTVELGASGGEGPSIQDHKGILPDEDEHATQTPKEGDSDVVSSVAATGGWENDGWDDETSAWDSGLPVDAEGSDAAPAEPEECATPAVNVDEKETLEEPSVSGQVEDKERVLRSGMLGSLLKNVATGAMVKDGVSFLRDAGKEVGQAIAVLHNGSAHAWFAIVGGRGADIRSSTRSTQHGFRLSGYASRCEDCC